MLMKWVDNEKYLRPDGFKSPANRNPFRVEGKTTVYPGSFDPGLTLRDPLRGSKNRASASLELTKMANLQTQGLRPGAQIS